MKLKIHTHPMKVLPVLLLILTMQVNTAEAQVITNGSMTGTVVSATVPPGWTAVLGYVGDTTSGLPPTPDTCSTTQPGYAAGSYITSIAAISASPNGGTWVGIVDNHGENEAVQQTITGLTVGKTYTVSFYVANYGLKFTSTGAVIYNNPGYVKAYINGTQIASSSLRPVSTGWELVSGSFVAAATSAVLQLDAQQDANLITYMAVDGVTVVLLCNAGTTAPSVNTSVNNICPATTTNLNTQAHTGTIPTNASLVWYTNNTHTGTAYATPTAATSGTYYAFYYDSANSCYSPASTAVTVSNASCGFGCNNTMYLSQGDTLYTIGTSTNPFTYPTVGTSSVGYNAIGLNPLDGKIYGIQANSRNLLLINTNGTSTNLGAITGLPAAGTVFAGEIDTAGNYYGKINTNNNELYKINLTTRVATLITLSASNTLPDFGYSVTTGLLYGVNSAGGQLVSINPSTGLVTNIGIIPGGTINFGAMYTSSTGEIFGVNNDGGFYQFNLTTGERVKISGATASSSNDGAHCVTVPITFSADLSVTKDDTSIKYIPGTNTTYTIVVTNNGPYGVLNANVSDPVPTGIPTANVSYTAVASAGSTTSVSGTQTGAINDLVGLPVGGTVTYTVVVSIPFSYTGNLTNTVTVTPPSNITDSNTANNTATDTDTTDICYKPGIAGTGLPTNHGISSLGRAGSDNSNWPMVRQSAWTALEAKTKGFVVNRLTTAQISAIPAANLVEGMMVYNTTVDCLQINTTGTAAGWSCFNTQTCPPN